jgi:lipopolysaccharide biosynthesis glycosyltransferase
MNTIVIGSSREQKLPSLVLEYTIQKHATTPVRVVHTYDMKFPSPKDQKNVSRTGFSFARFAVPKISGFEGLALYLECDQIVFKDVTKLFKLPFNSATVLRPKNQASVILIDCDHVRWEVENVIEGLDSGDYSYTDLMENLSVEAAFKISKSIPGEWNSLEKYEPGKTALLHYTNMAIQPWRRWGHPLGYLWMAALKGAMEAKHIPLSAIEEEIRHRYVVPEVLKEVKRWNIS